MVQEETKKAVFGVGEVANNIGCPPFWSMIIFNRKVIGPIELEPAKNYSRIFIFFAAPQKFVPGAQCSVTSCI
jgi:hypothetical protein